MSMDDEKWLLSPSDENPEPSSGENSEGNVPSIGDSDGSMENLRKAMEIPPKTDTGSDSGNSNNNEGE